MRVPCRHRTMSPSTLHSLEATYAGDPGLTRVHFSAQRKPFRTLESANEPHKKCLHQTEKWTIVSPCRGQHGDERGSSRARLRARNSPVARVYQPVRYEQTVRDGRQGLPARTL
jgi:hypothetical protein